MRTSGNAHRTIGPAGYLVLAVAAALAALAAPERAATAGPSVADLDAACAAGSPFLAAASFAGVNPGEAGLGVYDPDAPAVFVFSDTPRDRPQYVLARIEQVGTVFGLAYSRPARSVYASAYHKVQLPFGPGGPGAIYRIDLESGAIAVAITVPNAGADHHEAPIRNDRDAEAWTSRASLGDIDVSADGTELVAMNLADRRIYRFAIPSGAPLGSFAHGAAGETWAAEARPFGLAWHDGLVYHGVVHSAEVSTRRDDLRAVVYRSGPDGSGMEPVAVFDLAYGRGRVTAFGRRTAMRFDLDWQPWRDGYLPRTGMSAQWPYLAAHAMALVGDLEFDDGGNLLIGLRDRQADATALYRADFGWSPGDELVVGLGVGDILLGRAAGRTWRVDTSAEHYGDRLTGLGDESAMGGLAALHGLAQTVAGSYLVDADVVTHGVYWYDDAHGNRLSSEQLGRREGLEPYRALAPALPRAYADDEGPRNWYARGPATVGDVEVLCAPEVAATASPTASQRATATPTMSATATPVPPTATPPPTTTRAPDPTRTPTPTSSPPPGPIHLPLVLRERCDWERRRADVVLVMDTSSSMQGAKIAGARQAALAFVALMDLGPDGNQVAIVRFDASADVVRTLSRDRAAIDAAIVGLTAREGTHIDAGLAAALVELRSDRRAPANAAVIVLLTDGIHNGEQGADQRVAEQVREAGVLLYVIGLGADVDAAALLRMAADSGRYFYAPDSADLARIYGEIAADLECPGRRFWVGP